MQDPLAHASNWVQLFPSSHGTLFGAGPFTQAPVDASQNEDKHGSLGGGQFITREPSQTPSKQLSLPVHALLSSQGVPSFA